MEVDKNGEFNEEIRDDSIISITGLGIFVLENLLGKGMDIPENVMDKFTDCWK